MKELLQMSKQELWQLFPIIICHYNPKWPKRYLDEKKAIVSFLGAEKIFRITHIGSSAIPGIDGKPTIDILLEIKRKVNTKTIIEKMQEAGYIYTEQKDNPPPYMMFLKGYTPQGFRGQVFHVHVRYPQDWDEFYFRDYLISHPLIAKTYSKLKHNLAKQYQFNRDGYTDAKTAFIKKISRIARNEFCFSYKPKN